MTNITVNVRLFGAFRKYGETVKLSVPEGSPVGAIKDALADILGDQARGLILDSVLANETTILPRDYVIDEDASLSVLPPVCGG